MKTWFMAGWLAVAALNAGADELDGVAERYVVLELAMGRHDPAHVDAYFGPETLAQAADDAQWSLEEILQRVGTLGEEIARLNLAEDAVDQRLRARELQGRLQALTTRIRMAQDQHLPFDEESQLLFGARAPHHDAAHFEAVLADIDALLPGDGDLGERVNAFRDRFAIPVDRLATVFDAAIAECRRRTALHAELPAGESFRVEYVTDQPWSAYNWYHGGYHSLIQVNTDLPVYIDRAVDLGCHEGYPGHHVYNALLEENLVRGRGWVEYSLYPLFSPQSLIAEGSANYGIAMAFSPEERVTFEQEALFPLAGLDPDEAGRYYQLTELLKQLNYAGNTAARAYLDGEISADEAVAWLMKYRLSSAERARQAIRFNDTYRSYVINYNLGQDLVKDWVERGDADEAERWRRFVHLLSTPMSAADLQAP